LGQASSDTGVVNRDAVGVQHDVSGEAAVDRLVANNGVIRGRADVTVSLAIGLDGQRGDSHLGHRELDRAAALEEPLAEDRHRVGQRRQAEITIQRGAEGRYVASGRW